MIRYPITYFAAPILFAAKVAAVTGAHVLDTLATYTPLREELTGALYLKTPNERAWEQFVQCLEESSPEHMAQHAYAIYLTQPHAAFNPHWAPPGTMRFGSLGVSTADYYLKRNQVKLHFLPTRNGGSDLASWQLDARKADMYNLLLHVKTRYPAITNITSYTWLHHVPTYRALFPPSFVHTLAHIPNQFLGLWGQFVRWDGTANDERYALFKRRLSTVTMIDEAIDAIPLNVLGAVRPLQEFYDWYNIQ